VKLVHKYLTFDMETIHFGRSRPAHKSFFSLYCSIQRIMDVGFLAHMSEEQAIEAMERTLQETLKGSPLIKVINDKQVVMRSEHFRVGHSLRSGYSIRY